ncbi:hypothetical protein [Mycobacteroides abscessus]|uniref:Uncharacterized protein n=1 Tax=Mycobacteroides abscessus subsp. bolletii CRM-0020 TaxID=1306401 RepID=A0A829HLX3_9MYCO|nr:hypothetical protein [Mycobacteroides abscessus]EPQ21017.1 hypothetical protein J108_23695 [Mycobacteroides abscessus subsp. bolletii CRM-0020]
MSLQALSQRLGLPITDSWATATARARAVREWIARNTTTPESALPDTHTYHRLHEARSAIALRGDTQLANHDYTNDGALTAAGTDKLAAIAACILTQ